MVYDEVEGQGLHELRFKTSQWGPGCSFDWNSEDRDISGPSPGSKLRKLLEHPTPSRPPSIARYSGLSSR